MKKKWIKSSLLAGLISLLFSFSALRVGSINDVAKPYLGEYECKSATYGNKDLCKDYTSIVLELRADNTFYLRYVEKKGKKKEEKGTYEYDEDSKLLRFKRNGKSEIKRDFYLEKGEITGTAKLGGRVLCVRFEQK